ncbi:MAG: ribose-phosphate pyrophosphokinase [Chlamydiia bacterium]|nr:ribose-phosphate pyrophosphokinase [Chlamydiia bacterium]
MQSSFTIFSGSSHPKLAEEIATSLHVKLGKVAIERFPDGEIGMQVLENVRGKDVFIVQSVARRPNHYLMELLILVDALKRASVRSVTAVMPYYPYARQDRKEKGRVPITAKLVADLLERAGVHRVLTMDLHTEQIQGFFNIPVDNLTARPAFVAELKKLGVKNSVIVSTDVGSNRMARKYAEALKLDLAIIDKRRISAEKVEVYGLIGDVNGKQAILVDDIWSTGKTLKTAAKKCKEQGAKSVLAVVTHGLMLGVEGIEEIDSIWVTNTIPSQPQTPAGVKSLSIAPLFGKAIDCIVSAKSLSALFKSEEG